MSKQIKISRMLGGLEDLLICASTPLELVEQIRSNKKVLLHYINAYTIPVQGKLGSDDFISIKQYIDDNIRQDNIIKTIDDLAKLDPASGLAIVKNPYSIFIYEEENKNINNGDTIINGWTRLNLSGISNSKDTNEKIVIDENGEIFIFDKEYKKIVPQYVSDKVIKLAEGTIDYVSKTGNMQDFALVDDKLYIYKNIKATSESKDEKGKIYEFKINADKTVSKTVETTELEKVAHQAFSWYKDENKNLIFVCSGGSDSDAEVQIKDYAGNLVQKNVHNGRHITFILWDNSSNPQIIRKRVIDEYDINNPDTWYYKAYPTISRQTNEIAIMFTDVRDINRREIRVYNISDILNDNYTPKYRFSILTKPYSMKSVATQGFVFDGSIYTISLGYTENSSKAIISYNTAGACVGYTEFYHPDMENNSHVEVEGLDIKEGNIISGVWFGNGKFIILEHNNNLGVKYGGPINKPPSQLHLISKYDVTVNAGEAFSVHAWDRVKDTVSKVFSASATSLYLGSTKVFNFFRPTLLAIRPFGDKDKSKTSWMNFYAETDTILPSSITLGCKEWKMYSTEDDTKVMRITDMGNLRLSGGYLGFKSSTDNTYSRVLNQKNDLLEIRADTALSSGGGINLYMENHSSKPNSVLIFANTTNGGNLYIEDLPSSDPNKKGAIWNDSGTLKISKG